MEDFVEPMSPTMEAAVTLNEWYNSLITAGFTEEQALTLTSDLMVSVYSDDEDD